MKSGKKAAITALLSAFLVACSGGDGSDDDAPAQDNAAAAPPPAASPATVEFEVSVVNLTAGQPFSPLALVAHSPDYRLFELGAAATAGMELLAEGGDNSELLAEADSDALVAMTASADSPLGPGGSETITVSMDENEVLDLQFSLVTMLVNTNDAITAVRNLDISGLAAGESVSVRTISYDSGTEINSELSGTIPGPVDSGEGFNADRDDIADAIRGHSGAITLDGGLATSVLTDIHRWDNPVARVTVTRLP